MCGLYPEAFPYSRQFQNWNFSGEQSLAGQVAGSPAVVCSYFVVAIASRLADGVRVFG